MVKIDKSGQWKVQETSQILYLKNVIFTTYSFSLIVCIGSFP